LVIAPVAIAAERRFREGRRRRLRTLLTFRDLIDDCIGFSIDDCPLRHSLPSTSQAQSESIQHQHADDGDEVEHDQKGHDEESHTPVLSSNFWITDHGHDA
jgi:hypothetical protein